MISPELSTNIDLLYIMAALVAIGFLLAYIASNLPQKKNSKR
jgi:hypothetical protein